MFVCQTYFMCRFSVWFPLSCGRPFNIQLNHGVESVDKGDTIPHPGITRVHVQRYTYISTSDGKTRQKHKDTAPI